MNVESAIVFLDEASRYFENRPTEGEDMSHWSNVYNAENCQKIKSLILYLEDERKNMDREIKDLCSELRHLEYRLNID